MGVDSNGLHIGMTNSNALGLAEGGKVIMNGPMGATGVPKLSTFFAGFLLVLFTLAVVQNLVQSRAGRAIMAIRDNRHCGRIGRHQHYPLQAHRFHHLGNPCRDGRRPLRNELLNGRGQEV